MLIIDDDCNIISISNEKKNIFKLRDLQCFDKELEYKLAKYISLEELNKMNYLEGVYYYTISSDLNKISYYNKSSISRVISKINEFKIIINNIDDFKEILSQKIIKEKHAIASKPTKFLSKFIELNTELSQKILALFISYDNFKLEVLYGEDIKKAYLANNCYKSGTLSNSCMRYPHIINNMQVLNLYINNPKHIGLLTLYDKTSNLFVGRAILWNNIIIKDNENIIDSSKFLDRIYTSNSIYDEIFIKYAHENNIYYKENGFIKNKSKRINNEYDKWDNVKITAKNLIMDIGNEIYPYLDTLNVFYFDNDKSKILTNTINDNDCINIIDTCSHLTGSDGTYIFNNSECEKKKSIGIFCNDECENLNDYIETDIIKKNLKGMCNIANKSSNICLNCKIGINEKHIIDTATTTTTDRMTRPIACGIINEMWNSASDLRNFTTNTNISYNQQVINDVTSNNSR